MKEFFTSARQGGNEVTEIFKHMWAHKTFFLYPLIHIVFIIAVFDKWLNLVYNFYHTGTHTPFHVICLAFLTVPIFAFSFSSVFIHFATSSYEVGLINNQPIGLITSFLNALKKVWTIFKWAMLQGIVSCFTHFIKKKDSAASNGIMWFMRISWNVVSFFVVPLLVTKDIGTIEALKESYNLVNKDLKNNLALIGGFSVTSHLIGFVILIISTASTVGIAFALNPVLVKHLITNIRSRENIELSLQTIKVLLAIFGVGSYLIPSCIMSTARTIFRIRLYKKA